ncbi:uncharacterized protein BCR38DRAFT_155154 [Pseudomassariella vexata]|uniref:Uncharacterized protein n=1 Tax=Pseudomassariella vexata TaxID=1141098 RepID=A0A1Y2E8Y3_9PEZI|nr:uncharacterized protein BCR38DRAFT_155154 [Pseudomassariella vexata]ORY67325.1 hypothetical protein BCR38DRAFT_155154 [Pseudomassariella vexata]
MMPRLSKFLYSLTFSDACALRLFHSFLYYVSKQSCLFFFNYTELGHLHLGDIYHDHQQSLDAIYAYVGDHHFSRLHRFVIMAYVQTTIAGRRAIPLPKAYITRPTSQVDELDPTWRQLSKKERAATWPESMAEEKRRQSEKPNKNTSITLSPILEVPTPRLSFHSEQKSDGITAHLDKVTQKGVTPRDQQNGGNKAVDYTEIACEGTCPKKEKLWKPEPQDAQTYLTRKPPSKMNKGATLPLFIKPILNPRQPNPHHEQSPKAGPMDFSEDSSASTMRISINAPPDISDVPTISPVFSSRLTPLTPVRQAMLTVWPGNNTFKGESMEWVNPSDISSGPSTGSDLSPTSLGSYGGDAQDSPRTEDAADDTNEETHQPEVKGSGNSTMGIFNKTLTKMGTWFKWHR